MRKFYPYLQDSRLGRFVAQRQNNNILAGIDDFINRKLYTKITLLDWEENPIKVIEGEIVSGNQSKDGASSVRHVCNMSCTVDGGSYSVEDLNMDFAINKKVFVEIGVRNDLDEYQEYPILWFPQGVFYINTIGISSSTTGGVNLNLSFKDKMCMFNGDLGGKFGSTIVFDVMDTQLPNGEYTEQKVLLYDIVKELVNHYGGEDLNNMIINIPRRIQRIVRWIGDVPLYAKKEAFDGGNFTYVYTLTEPESENYQTYYSGDDVGYVYDDFYYTDELVAGPAETITSVLDKIKAYLGNYEYYYDVYGIFHFEEIKNYVNTTMGSFVLDNINEKEYSIELNDKAIYAFDSSNITSITVTPSYGNIKNDFIVQGLRQSTNTEQSFPIMYHLAIDEKPVLVSTQSIAYEGRYLNEEYTDDSSDEPEFKTVPLVMNGHYGKYDDIIIYKEPETGLQKAACVTWVENLPDVGNFNLVYKIAAQYGAEDVQNDIQYLYWDGKGYQNAVLYKDYSEGYYCKDWRTKLYMDGVVAMKNGTDQGHYFPELYAYWPQVYDLTNQRFFGEYDEYGNEKLTANRLTEGIYYLDFIEPSLTPLGSYSVKNIGRRTNVTVNDKINCLFQPEIPSVVFINTNISEEEQDELREECEANYQYWTQVSSEVFDRLVTGGYHNGAFDQIKYDLYLYTRYQKSISMTTLPVYWLEPNSRITIKESTTNTYGDFMISNINYTFGPAATMTVSCSEVAERF